MKKILFILLAIFLLACEDVPAQGRPSVTYHRAGQTYAADALVSKDGVIYMALVQTSETPPHADWKESGGSKSLLTFEASSNYTTKSAENGMRIKLLSGATQVILDDSSVEIGNNFYFDNQSGTAVSWGFGTGDSVIGGTPGAISAGSMVWAMLDDTNSWRIQEPGGGSGNVTKVGTPADNQIAVWTGDGTIEGGSNFTWDGALLEIEGNGRFTGYIEAETDPASGDGVGNRDYNDARYANLTSTNTFSALQNFADITISQEIDMLAGVSKIGQNVLTPTANTAYDYWSSHVKTSRMYDTAITFGEITFSYDDLSGLDLIFDDDGNSADAMLRYLGISDAFGFVGAASVDFGNSVITGANLNTEADGSASVTIATGDMGNHIFFTSASAVTVTIPDTLSESDGANFTVIAEGTGQVTITTSGNAEINGSTTFDVVISGKANDKVNAVQFIQKPGDPDNWIALGAY